MSYPTVKGKMVREARKFLNSPAPQTIVTSGTQALSAVLGCWEIYIHVDQDTFIREDTSAVLTATPVTTATGHFIPSDTGRSLVVSPENKLAAITAGTAGNLYISAIG